MINNDDVLWVIPLNLAVLLSLKEMWMFRSVSELSWKKTLKTINMKPFVWKGQMSLAFNIQSLCPKCYLDYEGKNIDK